jgi:WD40 repeat protein
MKLVPLLGPESDPALRQVVRRSGAEAWSVDWVDRRTIAACSRDGAVWLAHLDRTLGEEVEVIGFHGGRDADGGRSRGSALAVCSLGERLVASCGDDGGVCVWDLDEHSLVEVFDGHAVRSGIAFSGARSVVRLGDEHIASCGGDGMIRVWRRGVSAALTELTTPHGLRDLALTADGRLAYCGDNAIIGIWDFVTGEDRRLMPPEEQLAKQDFRKFPHHVGNVMAIVALPDGRLVTAGQDRTIRVWDASSLDRIGAPLTGHLSRVRWLAHYGDDRVVSAGDDGTVRLWSVDDGLELTSLRGHRDWVKCVAVGDDSRIASVDESGELRVWAIDGRERPAVDGHVSWILTVRLTDGEEIVTAGEDGTVRWWDLRSGALRRSEAVHDGWIRDLAILPGHGVVTCSEDRSVRFVPEKGRGTVSVARVAAPLWSIERMSPDTVLFGGEHGVIGGWRVTDPEARLVERTGGDVKAIARRSDREAVVVMSRGRRTAAELLLCDVEGETTPLLTTGVLDARCVAARGDKLAVGGVTVEVWDTSDRTRVAHLEEVGLVRALEWVNDDILVIADSDGIILLWRYRDSTLIDRTELDCGLTQIAIDLDSTIIAVVGTAPRPLLLHLTRSSGGDDRSPT